MSVPPWSGIVSARLASTNTADGRGLMKGGRAREVAAAVQTRLMADGMPPEQAAEAYIGVHSLVLGYSFVRAAGRPPVPLEQLLDRLLDGLRL